MIFLDDDIAIWHREHPGQFEEWLNSWKDMVYHTALGMLLQQQDAEDVTQEVFLRLYHHCYELKDTTSISTWLYRVTINKCIDVIRKRKRQNKWWIFAKADETEGTEVDLQHPGVQTERKEHAKVLFNALSKLPEDAVVDLAFSVGQTKQLEFYLILDTTQPSRHDLVPSICRYFYHMP